MATVRSIVSDILTGLKATNLDDRLSRRYIISRLQAKASTLIKQDADIRRLFRLTECWTPLGCLEFCEIDPEECGSEARTCATLMRSKIKLPEAYQTNYGNTIKLFITDRRKELKQTTFYEYVDIARRELKNPNVIYFILSEGYIYLPDTEIEELTGYAMLKNPFLYHKACGDTGCGSPLDVPFNCPDYLLDPIIKDLQLELAKIYRGLQDDNSPDDNTRDK